MRLFAHLVSAVAPGLAELFQQLLQTFRGLQEVLVTVGTTRIAASKLPVNEALHSGYVPVGVTDLAANIPTTTSDRDRRFRLAEQAFDFWRRLPVPMLTIARASFHVLSFPCWRSGTKVTQGWPGPG